MIDLPLTVFLVIHIHSIHVCIDTYTVFPVIHIHSHTFLLPKYKKVWRYLSPETCDNTNIIEILVVFLALEAQDDLELMSPSCHLSDLNDVTLVTDSVVEGKAVDEKIEVVL